MSLENACGSSTYACVQVFRSLQTASPSPRCVAAHASTVAAAAADAEIVATEVVDDKAEGIAHLRGVRGSPFKVGYTG